MKVQLQNTQGRIASSEILIKDIEEKHGEKKSRDKKLGKLRCEMDYRKSGWNGGLRWSSIVILGDPAYDQSRGTKLIFKMEENFLGKTNKPQIY